MVPHPVDVRLQQEDRGVAVSHMDQITDLRYDIIVKNPTLPGQVHVNNRRAKHMKPCQPIQTRHSRRESKRVLLTVLHLRVATPPFSTPGGELAFGPMQEPQLLR